jgi:hypothetical protein
MTTNIATMHPADLVAAWRARTAHKIFGLAPGHPSVSYLRGEVVWVWRAPGSPVRSSSKVHAHRTTRGVHVCTSDPVEGKTTRVKSRAVPLETWEQLETLVRMLVEGKPMVPRVEPRHRFSDGEADACTRIFGGGQ